jgi:type I restriction enzyme S subunit
MSKVEALLGLVQSQDDVAVVRKLLLKLATKGGFSSEGSTDWTKARLGDLGKWGSGGTPLRSQGSYYAGGTIPWLVIGDLNDAIVTKAATFITPEGLENSSASLLPENTLLIAMYGSIGKMGITGIQCATNQAIAYCKPAPEKVTLWYLFYALKSIQDDLLGRGQGLAQKNISQTILKAWTIPLPPLAEQRRIVAKVDELMALCDRLEAQLKERDVKQAALAKAALAKFTEDPTTENLQLLFHPSFSIEPKNLREVVLNMAIKGLVTNQSENEEPADKALVEMLARRKRLVDKKLIRQPKPASPISEDDHPFKAPASWRWARWGTICDWITYGFTRPMAHVSKGPPIVTAKNVQDGHLTFTNSHCADQKEYSELNPKDLPLRGDILITKDGTIGRAALVDTDEEFCINQSVAVLWLRSCLLYRPFLLLVIRSPFTQKPVKDAAEGMAIKHLSVSDFAEMLVALPPLEEQKRIVGQVEILMSIIDNLEAQLEASRTTGEKLLEAMVAELTSA